MAESLIHRFKIVYVFSSIEFGKNKEYLKVTVELGTTLATRKITLVYGGGILGLRVAVRVSASVGDSRVLGIILKALVEKRYITSITIGNEL